MEAPFCMQATDKALAMRALPRLDRMRFPPAEVAQRRSSKRDVLMDSQTISCHTLRYA